MLYTYISNL